MREAEIIEGNRLIAQFMGIKKDRWGDFFLFPFPKSTQRIMPGKMKYHSSWDWLYPVVQKIAQYMIDTDFGSERKLSVALNWWKHIANALEKASDIEVIHKHVVQFIKWYNLQTNQP